MRVSGSGLGNCLYTYFHAVALAERTSQSMIAPVWTSLRLGPLLRREKTLRQYGRMFRKHPDEIGGLKRLAYLIWNRNNAAEIDFDLHEHLMSKDVPLIVVKRSFTFTGLYSSRELIRRRFLVIVKRATQNHIWAVGAYVAVHIRHGDFAEATIEQHIKGQGINCRIPVSWFIGIIRQIRCVTSHEIRVFSDGIAEDLAELTALPGVVLREGQDEIGDLLEMAGASLLVGSQSTFSQWAAFLGAMPSIWIASADHNNQDPEDAVPRLFVDRNFRDVQHFAADALSQSDVSGATVVPAVTVR